MSLEFETDGCVGCPFLKLSGRGSGGFCDLLQRDVGEYLTDESEELYPSDCLIKEYDGITVMLRGKG